jgi:hypothetical protein
MAKKEPDMAKPGDYPKWVQVHNSHVVTQGDHRTTPQWPQSFTDRNGAVWVLVSSPQDELAATTTSTA